MDTTSQMPPNEAESAAAAKSLRFIRIMTVVLIATLAIGMIVVAVGIVTTLSRPKGPSAPVEGAVRLLAGEEIAEMAVGSDRLVLRIVGPGGERLEILDMTGTNRLGTIHVERAR
ncbi:MAG: hypothetical protein H6923_03065 [Alphaproteobacteria bacterium]|nr:hypothetical protein [Alphaproteobacteria bacterium]